MDDFRTLLPDTTRFSARMLVICPIGRIECDEGFGLDDLLCELERLERKALGYVKHGIKMVC
jgi:hypothetical protein